MDKGRWFKQNKMGVFAAAVVVPTLDKRADWLLKAYFDMDQ